MKPLLRYLLLICLLTALVACGTSDSGDNDTEPDPTDAPAEVEVEADPTDEPEPVAELVCEDAIGCVEVAPGDPIRVASALVVTGPNESLGLDSQYGVEIAIKDRGEIMGHEIELQAEDDGCSAEGGQTAGQKIVSDPSIVGVVGTSCSGAGVPASQIICGEGIVMVSPSNTAPVLTDEGSRQSCYFRTAHNDKVQGAAMANYVYDELGIRKAAALHDGDPYTEGLATVFRDAFTALGGEIVAFEAEASDATNVEPLLTSVAAAGPELIYYPVFIPLGSLLTKTARDIDGLEDVLLAAADGVLSPDFIEAAGDASEGMVMSGPDLGFGNSIYDTFLETYMADYGTEPTAPFHAHAYDATNMILDAVEAVAQMGEDGTLLIGRQALIDAVAGTSGVAGITGTLSCDENGDCADPKISVSEISGGDFVPVWNDVDGMVGGAMGGMVDELVCEDAIGCVEIAAGDPIRVASALVVTGPNESLGLDSQYGVEIAIKDRGEIMGHEIELQAEDDGCSAEGGQTAGQKIVSDPSIVGVVGTSCSGAGVPASQIICEEGIVMVSPSNTAPVLTDEGTRQSCYFRNAHNDKVQGAAMANYVYDELGIRKAAALHDGDPYTEGLATVFRDAFTALGGEIVAFEAEASDATNVEPLLTSVAAADPELIYYPVFIPLGSLLTKTARDIDGLEDVLLAAADGVLSPDFIEAAGDASEGMFMSGPDLGFGNTIYDAFLETYMADYGTEPTAPFHAHAYDATNMILDAVEAVAMVDGDGNMLVGRQALIDAVAATSGKAGITGTLTCDANGDCADPKISVSEINGGEFVPVWNDIDGMMEGSMMGGGVMMVDELVCDDAIGCVEVAAGDPIRVASALVVTGPNESLGLDSQYGVEIAIKDRGMIGGHEIELQAEDDGCSAEGGQTAGQKIVSDPSIVGVIGTSCSGAGVPASQIICGEGIAMVSPSNTAPVLTGEDTRESCYFRTAHNDTIQGAAMANYVYNELGITKAAAIHDGDPYTEGLASSFSDAFTALGGEIVAFEAEASDATNVEPLLTSVAAADPELIYYPVFIPLGSLLTKTARDIDGLEDVMLAAADGVLSPDFIEASGDAAEGMFMSGPDLGFGNEIYDTFLETYMADYGTEPTAPFHAHAYDATNLILNAVESVAMMDADGNMMIGRQALIDAIAATDGMAGITGTISCDANGDCADPKISVSQVSDAEFETVWQYANE